MPETNGRAMQARRRHHRSRRDARDHAVGNNCPRPIPHPRQRALRLPAMAAAGGGAEAVPVPGDSLPAVSSTNDTAKPGHERRRRCTRHQPTNRLAAPSPARSARLHIHSRRRPCILPAFRHSFHFLPPFRIRTDLSRKSNFSKGEQRDRTHGPDRAHLGGAD